jgi:hypothetical protein
MPKQNKKSDAKAKAKGTKVNAVIAGADDDFDDMLAELRAEDVAAKGATSSNRSASISNSSGTSTSSSSTTSQAAADEVSEEALLRACVRGDISLLLRWARRGIRVTSAEPLCNAVLQGKHEVVQCLVRELGADVNQANVDDYTPLYIASERGNLKMVRYLAIELGADIKAGGKGHTSVHAAAYNGAMLG